MRLTACLMASVWILFASFAHAEPQLELNAFAEASYALDWLGPPPNANRGRIPHRAYDLAEGFNLSMAGIDVQYGDEGLGLKLDLRTGLGARRLLGFTHVNDMGFIAPSQAYGYWQIGSFALDFGLFSSIFGLESPDKSWFNHHHSRSVARVLILPQQHLGMRAHWAVNRHFGFTALIENGGGLQQDGNAYLSVGTQAYITFSVIDMHLGYYGGPTEPRAQLDQFAHLFDFLLRLKVEDFFMDGTVNVGITAPDAPIPESEYAAYSAGLGYHLSSAWTAAGRIEYISDGDRALTRLFKSLTAGTLTLSFSPIDALLLRFETRLEYASNPIFQSGSADDDLDRAWVASTLSAVIHYE